jgi:hypothetical protein
MSQKQPSKSAMDKIMSGQVKQVPRWHFVMRNIVLWTLGIMCVLFGAITVSLVIFTFANSALAMRGVAYQTFWQHIIVFVPLLWIFGTALFIGLFKLSIQHTKRGYKYSLTSILFVSFLLSIITGVGFYFLGVSHIIDDILGTHFRVYHSVEKRQAKVFENPDKGVVIGRVIEVGENEFTLITPSGMEWKILHTQIPDFKKEFIVEGSRFIVVGKKMNEEIFVACDIRNRKMVGSSKQIQQRHLQQRLKQCNQQPCHATQHIKMMPQNIDDIVKDACAQVQTQ